MFNLFKKQQKKPQFILIRNFHKKKYYFIRIAEWGWLDPENIFIKDHRKSRLVTPTAWERNIFLSANGEMTIEAFVYYTASLYKENIPETLEQAIIFELLNLAESNFIAIVNEKQKPRKEFDLPGLTPK
jgi:hypothetical protein